MILSKISRRQLLKAGAGTSVLSLAGCSGGDASPSDDEITSAAIHPAIGIARVGNSESAFYLGPELPGVLPSAPGGFKDASGAIKRQGARFRIFGLNRQKRVVRELTADEAEITWQVQLTNAKAAWYCFDTALDIPGAKETPRRNASYEGADRQRLIIDPGPRQIAGRDGRGVVFDGGSFLGEPVPLGELRTDEAGRLIVLGGKGRALSPVGQQLVTFANNEGWCDDISDGPVTASVRLRGRALDVEPAWVVVSPPNYGPSIAAGYCSLYDVITQTMIDRRLLMPPTTVSFLADIYPLFDRLSQLQWVNQGALQKFGWGSPEDFLDPALVAALADPSATNKAFREGLFARFRNPDFARMEPDALPPVYGDAMGLPATSPRNWLAITPVQYANLRRWAAGDFVSDVPKAGSGLEGLPERLEDLPIQAQPAALDRAALEACLGEAFHPGCEATWPMRIGSMYAGLYRLAHRPEPEPDFGTMLTPERALSVGGPLAGCRPGSISRWMAVPWQADTSSCRSGYDPSVDPYLPTFWAARVPNQVLSQQSYGVVMDASLPLAQRQKGFAERAPFFRNIDGASRTETLTNMVQNWHRLGVIEERPGPKDGAFPAMFKVESERGFGE